MNCSPKKKVCFFSNPQTGGLLGLGNFLLTLRERSTSMPCIILVAKFFLMSHLASILLGGSDDGFRAEQNHGEIGSCNSKDPHELTTLGLLNDVETN